jgi:DNA-binding response OmpR family regulator
MKEAVGSSKTPPTPAAAGIIRFGNFEVDTSAGELRRSGIKLKLSGQPFDVLLALLDKPGQVVTREELHDKLWSQDTFVDFEHGLNKAINKVVRYSETVPIILALSRHCHAGDIGSSLRSSIIFRPTQQ